MTTTELDSIRRAVELLKRLLPENEPHACDSSWRCPVARFAKRYLVRQPGCEVSSQELWQFYTEVSSSGELEPLPKAEFLRRIPTVMEETFGVKKSHAIAREGQTVRGFKGVGIREQAVSSGIVELELEAE